MHLRMGVKAEDSGVGGKGRKFGVAGRGESASGWLLQLYMLSY
jgi:hypothetical protein